MSYVSHAMTEFRAAGFIDENGKYCDEMQELMCKHILKLLEVFSEEGHSGFSAPYAINMFSNLAKFEPLVPLTGEDWEWVELNYGEDTKYQNTRCSRVFKDADGKAYDIDGRVFYRYYKDEDGVERKSHYTSRDSRVYITFPYTPYTEYVHRE